MVIKNGKIFIDNMYKKGMRCTDEGIDLLLIEEFWINHITLMTSEGSLSAGHDPLHLMVDWCSCVQERARYIRQIYTALWQKSSMDHDSTPSLGTSSILAGKYFCMTCIRKE